MIETVGAYEAKTHLSNLLDRVEHGESLIITRNGRPVARLVPAEVPAMGAAAASDIVERFKALREEFRAAGVRPFSHQEIVELIHAGRKY